MDALAFINAAGAALAGIAEITPEVTSLVTEVQAVLASGQPTDAQWTALHAVEAQNTATLNAPMEGE